MSLWTLLAVAPLLRGQTRGEPAPRPEPPEITEHYGRMLRYHERMDGNVPDGAVVFIGDSLTQGLCVAAVTAPSVNYGIGSDTTVGVLQRIPRYRSLERAAVVVVEIGVNDMGRRDNEAIVRNYSRILEALPKAPRVVVNAVLPVDERRLAAVSRAHLSNVRIRDLNTRLSALCQEQAGGRRFLDVGEKLVDGSGNLNEALSEPDGVHLNSRGNRIWIEGLRQAVQAIREHP